MSTNNIITQAGLHLSENIITQAGLTDVELGSILGVSKVMAWKYRTGRAAPRDGLYMGRNLHARLAVLLGVLTRLVEKGTLPKVELTPTRNMDPEITARRAAMTAKLKKLVDDRVEVTPANK